MTKAEDRQIILEALKILDPKYIDHEAIHEAILDAFELELYPTKRQRILAWLTGRPWKDFIP